MENNTKIPKLSITTISGSDFSTYCEFGCFESDKKEIDCRVLDKDGSATKIANKIVKAVNNHDKLIEALAGMIDFWNNNIGNNSDILQQLPVNNDYRKSVNLLQSIEQQ